MYKPSGLSNSIELNEFCDVDGFRQGFSSDVAGEDDEDDEDDEDEIVVCAVAVAAAAAMVAIRSNNSCRLK